MKNGLLLSLSLLMGTLSLYSQEYRHQDELLIWPNGAPGSNEKNWPFKGYKQEWRIDSVSNKEMAIFVTEPTLQVFLPPKEKNTGAAVVVCPGGGYNIVVIGKEGYDIAKRLNELGIAAIVLKYRHYNVFAARDDAHRAIRYTRSHAKEWNIHPSKIGIGGFSAGGHLALHAAANLMPNDTSRALDALDKISNRPDFLMLVYPGTYLPEGAELDKTIPPTFIVVAGNDGMMPLSYQLYDRLNFLKVPAELHIYQNGGHGFGAGTPECQCSNWLDLFRNWLQVNKFIN